jgi:hypothetical protein
MADVAYNTASFPALVRTLKGLMDGSAKRPRIIMGYKPRDPSERTLWAMAEAAGIVFTLVGRREGSGGAPVEVWDSEAA